MDQTEIDRLFERMETCGKEERRQIRNRLVQSNIGFVLSIAKRYLYRGLPAEDVVQEGLIGLGLAIDKYDRTRGYKLVTYAAWWIKATVRLAIDRKSTIYPYLINSKEMQKLRLIHRAHERFEMTHVIEPDNAQLLDSVHGSSAKLGQQVTAADIARYRVTRQSVSLDGTIAGDKSPLTHLHLIADPNAISSESEMLRRAEYRALEWKLNALPMRANTIMRMRFGIGEPRGPYSLNEIGMRFGVSRERIRQIVVKVLEKLQMSHEELEELALVRETIPDDWHQPYQSLKAG